MHDMEIVSTANHFLEYGTKKGIDNYSQYGTKSGKPVRRDCKYNNAGIMNCKLN